MVDEESTGPSAIPTSESTPDRNDRALEAETTAALEEKGGPNGGDSGKASGGGKKAAKGEATGLDNMEEAVNCYYKLNKALKPYKIEVLRDASGKPVLKDGKLQGTVTMNGKHVEDPAMKEDLLKAQLLKDAIKGKMKTKEGQDYFMRSSLGELVSELADIGFNVKDGLDGGMLSTFVKALVDIKNTSIEKAGDGWRAGKDRNATAGQLAFDGIKSTFDERANKNLDDLRNQLGVRGCQEVYAIADRINRGGHATEANANSPTIRTSQLPTSPPHSTSAPGRAPAPAAPSK